MMAGSGVLKILIVGADNLDRIVTAAQQLPYYILECGSQRSRSKPCADSGINPTWNTAHKFNISNEVSVLAVIKDDTTKGIIGQGTIDLPRAKQYGKDEGAVVLSNLGGNPAGTLRYKLKYSGAPGSTSPTPAGAGPSPRPAAILAPAQLPANTVVRPPSEAGSSSGQYHPSPRAAPAAAVAAPSPQQSAADDDSSSAYDDPMLAAVTSKVSLAKQAMQQLTAELAELTGADSAAADATGASSPFANRQPPLHSQSLRERGASAAMQQQQFRSFRQPRVSAGSLSPGQVSPSHWSPQGTELAGYQNSWRSSGPAAAGVRTGSSGGELSADELLLRYGGEQAADAQRIGSTMLIRQLQQALVAAHSEKVATEEELSNVREAMAEMSKQHYDAVKRLRDAAGPAAAGLALPLNSATGKHLQMVDAHPPRAHGRVPRVSADSNGSGGQQQQQQAHGAAAAAVGKEFNEEMGSPVPAYKLQIQIHQLERQLAEQTSRTQEEATKREAMAAQVAALQEKLDAQLQATRVAEANAKEAEAKAAQQATLAAAARAEVASARETSKEAQLAGEVADLRIEMSDLRSELTAALQEKDELEEALGLMEKNNSAQVAALQGELQQLREEAASLRAGNEHVASLQEQLAAARAEASGLRNNNEDVDYLQSQLRRTLRDNVELRHKLQMLQQASRQDEANGDEQEKEDHSSILSEHEALMTELVNTKLQLAELKEQQVRMQRQLYKAQQEGLIAL